MTTSFILLVLLAQFEGIYFGIDPGHGGEYPGAIGPVYGVQEKDINLLTSRYLDEYLRRSGAETALTRLDDRHVTLMSRTNFFNAQGVDYAFSVHHNAVTDPNPMTTGVFVYPGQCQDIPGQWAYTVAQAQQERLNVGFGWSSCDLQGVHEANFHMVRETTMPSCLTEILFVSHAPSERQLQESFFLKRNAYSIYLGFCDYFQVEPTIPDTLGGAQLPHSDRGHHLDVNAR
jgi:N-acetylmuramoyl-L-alanine amidase